MEIKGTREGEDTVKEEGDLRKVIILKQHTHHYGCLFSKILTQELRA